MTPMIKANAWPVETSSGRRSQRKRKSSLPGTAFMCRVGIGFCGIWLASVLSATLIANAQVASTSPQLDESELRRQAAAQWHTTTDDELADALNAARQSLLFVKQFLQQQGEYQRPWRDFLRWDDLQRELAASDLPSAERLRLAGRLFSGAADLVAARQSFGQAASALDEAAAVILRHGTSEQEYFAHVDELIGVLCHDTQPSPPATEDSHNSSTINSGEATGLALNDRLLVERNLNWLDQRNLAEPFVTAFQRFRHPNLSLRVSTRLLNTAVGQEKSAKSSVNESILGTTYIGRSSTISKTRVELQPNSDSVSMRFLVLGESTARTTGYNGRGTVNTRSTTRFEGEKMVAWNPDGFESSPATAKATNSSQILNASSGGIIGNRVARRRAYEEKAGTEREAAARTREVVRHEMDKAIGGLTTSLRDNFYRRLKVPLSARDALPQQVSTKSTEKDARLTMLIANAGQLSVNTGPPEFQSNSGPVDALLQLHESALNNLLSSYLAGRRSSDEKIGLMAEEVLGTVPQAFRVADDEEVWTIGFQDFEPVVVRLQEDALRITIRAKSLQVGQQTYPGAIITAVYQPSPTPNGLAAKASKRLGVQLLPSETSEGQPLGVRQQVFRSMVRRRFGRLLPTEFHWKYVSLSDPWPDGTRLRVKHVRIENGWLTMPAVLETVGATGPSSG